MLQGNAPVKLVKGEAYLYQIEFDSESSNYVQKVYMSCSKLDFCHELVRDGENLSKYSYLFTKEETKNFEPTNTLYTITVESSVDALDPQKLINQTFEVLDDKNILSCGG